MNFYDPNLERKVMHLAKKKDGAIINESSKCNGNFCRSKSKEKKNGTKKVQETEKSM